MGIPHHEEHLEAALVTLDRILKNQALATHHIANQQTHSPFAQTQLIKSLNIMNSSLLKNGKIVVCGIGKSYKIGCKVVSTLNSLGIQSAALHPSEALHGDLGILHRENHDCVVMISSSGKSPELLQLLPFISEEIPIVLLTNRKDSLLSMHPQVKSLLYAELPQYLSEENIYGLNAPTISTTLCLTLADAVCIALAELYISDIHERKRIFGERHPGGAIGEAFRSSTQLNSFLNTPTSATSLSSMSGNGGVLSSASSALTDHLTITAEGTSEVKSSESEIPKVVFDIGVDDAIDDELRKAIELSSRVKLCETFGSELEILQSSVLYDFLLIQERHALRCEKMKEVIRQVYDDGYTEKEQLAEMVWRLKQACVRIR